MRAAAVRLRLLNQVLDGPALQTVLERAPRYSRNVSGEPPPAHAAEAVFLELPNDFERSRKFVLGIEHETRLVGCIDVLRGFPDASTAMLGLLLLAEDAQGKGLGRAAFAMLEESIRAWPEIKTIRIGVAASNAEVLGFWRKLGFAETGARRPYENGSVVTEVIVLEKPIA